jgi:anti-anti-sigma factor
MLDAFTVDTHREGPVWVFSTHGYINNVGGEAIARRFEEAHAEGGSRYLFDLTDSKIINSIGVSFLIEILERVLEVNGVMAFCRCAPIIEKTFKIMGITQYAKLYATAEEALSDMHPSG